LKRPVLLLRAIGVALGLAALGFIFLQYGKADFLVMVVNQLWGCF
jgi:hypothetical protein